VIPEPAGATLRRVLLDARDIGLLGNDDPQRHLDHAAAFVEAAASRLGPDGPEAFLDLGTGAGVPGLPLALAWPTARVVFVDAGQKRCAFVAEAVARLGIGRRAEVRCGRAEALGRDPQLRAAFPLVVARSFGPPALTAELGTPFLRVGGLLAVSEPPEPDPTRWPAEGLAELGCGPADVVRGAAYGVALVERRTPVPERYPRRTGIPGKRPLW
jgi:16S rRNA (guanine527-N7)-methyltransferase